MSLKETQIPQIRAEMLLNFLYPDLERRWIAGCEGTFYRNYNQDILSLDPEENKVSLSRDGFLNLLPKGLLSMEDELKQGDLQEKHAELEEQLKILRDAFMPFDSLAFRRQLAVERQLSELLDNKTAWILKTYFGVDLAAQENPYVCAFAVLLLYVRQLRGDFDFLRGMLSYVFGCDVTLTERRYSEMDSTRYWLPAVRYELLLPDLSAPECREMYDQIRPLIAFLEEWWVPMELHLEIVIRQHGRGSQLDSGMVADYNVEL